MEILSEIIAFVTGLVAGYSVKIVIDNRRNSSSEATSTKQTNNKVGGHQAGRDINVRDTNRNKK
jgi:hypothetical protein